MVSAQNPSNDRRFPTALELLDARMQDGGKPPLRSRDLYEGLKKLTNGDDVPNLGAEKTARQLGDEITRLSDFETLADLDSCMQSLRDLKDLGDAEVKYLREHPEEIHGQPGERSAEPGENAHGDLAEKEDADKGDSPQTRGQSPLSDLLDRANKHISVGARRGVPGNDPESPGADVGETESARARRGVSLQQPRGPRIRVAPGTKAVAFLTFHQHTIKLLIETALKRNEFVHALVQRASARDKRSEFIDDRAHAVVKQTLLALDKEFRDVGFGSWMPFRFPDQWLMFCGVMRRVLAANGLIHAKHPEIYRRLLEETPTVMEMGPASGADAGAGAQHAAPLQDPGLDFRTPRSWAQAKRMREIATLHELYTKIRQVDQAREDREAAHYDMRRFETASGAGSGSGSGSEKPPDPKQHPPP